MHQFHVIKHMGRTNIDDDLIQEARIAHATEDEAPDCGTGLARTLRDPLKSSSLLRIGNLEKSTSRRRGEIAFDSGRHLGVDRFFQQVSGKYGR